MQAPTLMLFSVNMNFYQISSFFSPIFCDFMVLIVKKLNVSEVINFLRFINYKGQGNWYSIGAWWYVAVVNSTPSSQQQPSPSCRIAQHNFWWLPLSILTPSWQGNIFFVRFGKQDLSNQCLQVVHLAGMQQEQVPWRACAKHQLLLGVILIRYRGGWEERGSVNQELGLWTTKVCTLVPFYLARLTSLHIQGSNISLPEAWLIF